MTRKEALTNIIAVAEPLYGEREARSIAYLLLNEFCGISGVDIALEPRKEINFKSLSGAIEQLKRGRPIQYIVGSTEFDGLTFAVTEGVLIPRPETEELVRWIASEYEAEENVQVLDIGTGSGAIAIALANRLSDSRVVGVDISDAALKIATENAKRNDVSVQFEQVDILAQRSDWSGCWHQNRYSVIVSNPPYVPKSDKGAMHCNVTEYEPHQALFVDDDDPLIFYRKIAEVAQKLLNDGGALYFEIYERLGQEMIELLQAMNYVDVELRKDIHGKERMIKCRKR